MRTNQGKPRKGFMDGYKTYDPEAEGYGSPYQWKGDFHERMGIDEARRIVADGSPYDILGVAKDTPWDQIKKAFRKLAMQHHPDKGGDPEMFKKVRAAFEVLMDRYE